MYENEENLKYFIKTYLKNTENNNNNIIMGIKKTTQKKTKTTQKKTTQTKTKKLQNNVNLHIFHWIYFKIFVFSFQFPV